MKIEFRYRTEDLLAYQRYFSRRISFRNNSSASYLFLLPAAVLLLNLYDLDATVIIVVNVVMIALIPVWFFLYFFQSPKSRQMKFEKAFPYFRLDCAAAVSLDNDSLSVVQEFTSSTIDYRYVKELCETPTHLFLICENASAVIIPTKEIPENEMNSFRQMIIEKTSSRCERKE